MINIIDKYKCCGCSACVQICPKQCISFEGDEKGFRYPHVDRSLCINCGLCDKVCPTIHVGEPRKPLKVYAAVNPNEGIRMKSSSGGIFTLLAEAVINDGGVVFGARFNDQWEVVHDYTETIEGVESFRGSKYVQSIIGDSFKQVKSFLQEGRKVLFSGTPCQVSGLNLFLGKVYANLITVDIVCHGVPSPKVWKDYFNSIVGQDKCSHVSFRDKRNGWKNYGLSVNLYSGLKECCTYYHSRKDDMYLKGYMSNVFLRNSCYKCSFKNGNSNSVLTLADYWGGEKEHPNLFDDQGMSCVICYGEQSVNMLKALNVKLEPSEIIKFLSHNPVYSKNNKIPDNVKSYWREYSKSGVIKAIQKYGRMSFTERMRSFFIKVVIKLGLLSFVKKILRRR